ncbi:MAG: cold shock domain-containing protein [Pseudomonadota bacterium]
MMTDEVIVQGVVKWFDLAKGFGFVVAEGVTQDILLHVNVVRDFGRNAVAAGDVVSLAYSETDKGLQATQLTDVQLAAQSEEGATEIVPSATDDLKPGRLKWFDKSKGYGFVNIFGENEDVFVHIDILRNGGMLEAQVGEAMCVVLSHGAKGAAATAVYTWDIGTAWLAARELP